MTGPGMGAAEHPGGTRDHPEETAEDLYDNAPCGYLSASPDGTIVRVNATFLRWTGYRREELVGARRFHDLLTAGGRIYHETHYAPLLQMQGSVREIALDIVRADRTRLPVLLNSVLRRDAEGRPTVVRTTVFDATDRKRYERELLAARNREHAARERVERLQDITAAIAAAPGAEAIAAHVTRELAASFGAQRAGVAVMDDPASPLRVLAQTGEPQADDVAGSPFEPAFDEGDDQHGAAVRLPLAGAPATSGRLWLAFDRARPFPAEERAFLAACAEQTALALERARLYEVQRDVAQTLQQKLLGEERLEDRRCEVATAYLPAGEHLEVGGDWYDAFALPGDKVGIVVGDVVGRGLAAASAMGQLRSAVRALAGAGHRPATVLEHLDTFVAQIEDARHATLAYAEVDPSTGDVCCACAGHLPPLLLAPGREPALYMEGRSALLGIAFAGAPGRADATFRLAPGSGFLLYTDGLVERRGEPIDAGLDRLVSAVAARAGASPAELVEALPGALLERGAGDDDVCLLAFRLAAPGSA